MMKIDAGTRLGEYEILEPIGSGGMGSVYLARHVHMGKKYAVKVLPESLAGDENFVARFRDEARVMADLRHPRIVQVHYMGVDGGRYFLAMDYVVGPRKAPMSLQDYFSYRAGRSKRHIDEEVARVWATQVAEAMAHAHERGVVHRDIKPGNVLIDADSNARLTDFGLAKAVGREFMVSQIHNSAGQSLGAQATRAGSRGKNVDDTLGAAATIASGDSGTDASSGGTDGIIGTYDYMAPEQRGEGDGQVDRRSDIYSFGVLLYRMLTGKRPVGMTKAPSQLVPGLSKSWDAIISRCLEEDKDARYQSADELLNELHQIKSARRDRRVAVGLMIACLVVIVTGLVWLFRPGTVNGPSPIPEGPEQVTQSDKPAGFADIIPLKAKADIAWEKVKNVDPRQGFVKMIEEADVVRRSVEAYLLAKDYASAQSACRKLLDKCTTIESLESDRQSAIRARAAAVLGRQSAKSAGAEIKAAKSWREAGQLDTQASKAFDGGRFSDAKGIWEDAASRYSQAAEVIRKAGVADREYRFVQLTAQARSILAKMPSDRKKLTAAQKSQLRQARKAILAALVYKPADREALALKRSITTILAPPKTLTVDLGGGEILKLTLIPAGKFLMGSPKTETGRKDDEGPQREVMISEPFYMGVHEVTQAQWQAVMETKPWDDQENVKSGPNNAASYISWDDAKEFCEKLSKKTGRKVVLPTEAQWEYACRAGSKTAYCFGDDVSKLGDYAWYYENADKKNERYAHPVGQKKPNAFGLYDMHGNVLEWCRDWYDVNYYAKAKNVDPENTTEGTACVVRGGAWDLVPQRCRAASRHCFISVYRFVFYGGFRVVVVCGSGVD